MTFPFSFDPLRPIGFETGKSYVRRWEDGFWQAYIRGPLVADIGYRGGRVDAKPLFEGVYGVELGDHGYDGLHLPFSDGFIDTVYLSHIAEHVSPSDVYLREWWRVIRIGGTMILVVPHAFLYERRITVPPSRWSGEHVRSFTPASLLQLVEETLEPNTYRVRFLEDNDVGYDYSLPVDQHPVGCLEIVCVIEKITPPTWAVET